MQLVKISSFEPSLRNFRPGGIFDSPAVASGVLFRGLGSFVVRKVLFFRSGLGFRLRLRLGLGFGFVLRLLAGKLGLRGFQLLTQAAGRAGRRDDRGRVFLQTYQPQHYAVQYAAKQDYEGFYEEEMLMRQMMGYPPFSAFFSILLTGAAQEEAAQAAQELAERLAQADEEEIATILGPTALPKFRGEYRYQIIVKAAEEEPLRQLVLPTAERMKKERNRNVRVGLALNPTNIV